MTNRNPAIEWLRAQVAKIPESPNRLSILHMARAGADTALNWLDAAGMAMRGEAPGTGFAGTGIGPAEAVAPLGLAAMAPLAAVRNAALRPYTEGGIRASKMVGYDPVPLPQRPWHADYPSDYERGFGGHGAGRPLKSPEGVVIDAPFVAGRRTYGGADQGLQGEDVWEVGRRVVGGGPRAQTARELGRDVGRLRRIAGPDGPRYEIGYLGSLPEAKQARVIAHEVAHAIDDLAGRIDTRGLMDELRQVYHDLATGQQGRTRNRTQPEHLGYRGDDVRAEYVAEAIRAYMVDPNYLKTVAPKTARAIREAANENPQIAQYLQFNANAGLPLPSMPTNAGENQDRRKEYASGGSVTGPLLTPIPGRTDALPIDAPEGAYVIPADVVSGLGEGNTLAGTRALTTLLKRSAKPPRGRIPSLRRHRRYGGAVPIAAAGGEYIVAPELVESLGGGDIERGHRVLDAFVKAVRAATIHRLASLPPPVR